MSPSKRNRWLALLATVLFVSLLINHRHTFKSSSSYNNDGGLLRPRNPKADDTSPPAGIRRGLSDAASDRHARTSDPADAPSSTSNRNYVAGTTRSANRAAPTTSQVDEPPEDEEDEEGRHRNTVPITTRSANRAAPTTPPVDEESEAPPDDEDEGRHRNDVPITRSDNKAAPTTSQVDEEINVGSSSGSQTSSSTQEVVEDQQDARRQYYLTKRNAVPVSSTQTTTVQTANTQTTTSEADRDEDRHNRIPVVFRPESRVTNDPLGGGAFTGSVSGTSIALSEDEGRHGYNLFSDEQNQENPDPKTYTRFPSAGPSGASSETPSVLDSPTSVPTGNTSTSSPTTSSPTTSVPTTSVTPTSSPTIGPTKVRKEITPSPTAEPSGAPSESPSEFPSTSPSALPSTRPTVSQLPTISEVPTGTLSPSSSPSIATLSPASSPAPSTAGTTPPTSQPTKAVTDTEPSVAPTVDCTATQAGFFGTLSNNVTIVEYAYEIVTDLALLEDAADSNSTNETNFFLNTQVLPSVEGAIVDRVLPALFASKCSETGVATTRMAKPQGVRMLMKNSDLYHRQLELVGLYSRPEDIVIPTEACQFVENATDCRVVSGGISFFLENMGVNESEKLTAQVLSIIRTSMNDGDLNDASLVIKSITFSNVTYDPVARSIADGVGERPPAGRMDEFALTTITVGSLVIAFICMFIYKYNLRPPVPSNNTYYDEEVDEEGEDQYLVQDQDRGYDDDQDGDYRDDYQDEPSDGYGDQSASYDDGTTGSNSYSTRDRY